MKMMHFADGVKEIVKGQQVVSTNGQPSGHHSRIITYTVESVGSKLVTMTNGDKFFLATGKMQTQYNWGTLYSSKEAFEKEKSEQKVINEVKSYFNQFTCKLTLEQALKIKEIMGDAIVTK